MRPYSGDLRDRFVLALERGMTARAAARLLDVSASTGVRWAARWRSRGDLKPGKVGGHRRPILESERDWLLERLAAKPDLTLHALLAELERERGVVVSCDTLWRFVRAQGIRFKKRRSSPRSRTGPTSPGGASGGAGCNDGWTPVGSSSSTRPG